MLKMYVCVPSLSRFLRINDEHDIISPFNIHFSAHSNDLTDVSVPKLCGEIALEEEFVFRSIREN